MLDHEIKKSEMHHRLIKERVEGLEGDSRALLQERNQLKEIVEEETRAHNAEVLMFVYLFVCSLCLKLSVAISPFFSACYWRGHINSRSLPWRRRREIW